MRRTDIISGCFLTVFGLISIFVLIPAEISGSSDYGLAPDFFPMALAWLFTGLSVLLVIGRLVPMIAGDAGEDEAVPMHRADWGFITVCALFLAAGYLAIEQIGFMAGAAAVIAVAMIAMGGWRNKPALVLVSLIMPAVIASAFKYIFTIYLP